jgi:hypothetical protein
MADDIADPGELERIERMVDGWLAEQGRENPVVSAVDKEAPPVGPVRRWYVRLQGEQKGVFAVWFALHQRTLHYETYVMPAPEENEAELYEHLLRRNLRFNGAAFAVGAEDAVYLVGNVAVHSLDPGELDRILGSLYSYVEQCFRPAMRIGYASKFGADPRG